MKMYINGQWQNASNGATIDVLNPATEQVIDTVPEATEADVDLAVAAAKAAFDGWRKMPAGQRSQHLKDMSRKLEAHKDFYSRSLTEEQGDTLKDHANDEFPWCINTIDYYAQLIKNGIGRVLPADNASAFNFVIKEPYGPTACIIPFNYPFLILFWKIAPALAAGNTVVVKPSEKTPLSTLRLVEKVIDHFPPGVINIVTGAEVAGRALVNHRDILTVAFTGSTGVGEEIIRSTAGQVKNLLLELGGKDAAVVTQDIEPSLAARALASSALWNGGQICTSTERIYVHESIYDEFLAYLKKCFENVRLGNGLNSDVDMGPLCDASGFCKVEQHIADAVEKGANIVTGGKRASNFEKGFFFEPTIIANANHTMLCMTQETFGPVVAVMPYSDFDDAIDLVNSTKYGLGAVLMSHDHRKVKRFFEDVKAGTVWINDPLPDNVGGPFGGMKTSGFGDVRELGPEGLELFMETKHVHWEFEPELLADKLWLEIER